MDSFYHKMQAHPSDVDTHTYLNYYEDVYSSKLKEIDLFIKSSDLESRTIGAIANLLDMEEKEIVHIIDTFNIENMNKSSFFIIMTHGSSDICKLLSREVDRKLPFFYSFDDISYIYDIPYETVAQAAYKAKLKNITGDNITTLFSNIPM